MKSVHDCLAKAAEMDREARLCPTPSLHGELQSMAETWRYLAQQALWQDQAPPSSPTA